MPDVELVDPLPYAGWWPWVALAIVVAVVGWYVWVLRSTRGPAGSPRPDLRPTVTAAPAPNARRDPYAAVRGVALARFDDVQRRYDAGELDLRGANLEIRFALREFATARTGVDTSAMTAAQARGDRRTRPLAALLENTSVPSFAPTTRARLARSLDQARKRVTRW
ncbi:conserved hypothetical protein [Cellulomonas flavigena DSM 20109]|uniref:Uncharacterized protein n=1 Tax=Cellulomonas flavigena (strain ATCC 482 / DSM 20109 / BCRC 11376 / JCM 18109 / NBRC 3775 / NCIMB 8073 / NRS 134) TaxID=446466 RepID=D5UL78_CELFN|nr:hypothetical protein [Cellulomonas flavigena]ADG75960.1 conserved hypothetical protein [Cellulomonas flavigena DSM 20109]